MSHYVEIVIIKPLKQKGNKKKLLQKKNIEAVLKIILTMERIYLSKIS